MKKQMSGFLLTLVVAAFVLAGCASRNPAVVSSNPGPVLVAPPEGQSETPGVAPSQEHVWVEGYWVFINNRYVWIPGQWEVRPRTDAVWVPGYWSERAGAWYWTPGQWQ